MGDMSVKCNHGQLAAYCDLCLADKIEAHGIQVFGPNKLHQTEEDLIVTALRRRTPLPEAQDGGITKALVIEECLAALEARGLASRVAVDDWTTTAREVLRGLKDSSPPQGDAGNG